MSQHPLLGHSIVCTTHVPTSAGAEGSLPARDVQWRVLGLRLRCLPGSNEREAGKERLQALFSRQAGFLKWEETSLLLGLAVC